jgi:hypothetical protein
MFAELWHPVAHGQTVDSKQENRCHNFFELWHLWRTCGGVWWLPVEPPPAHYDTPSGPYALFPVADLDARRPRP